MPPPVSEKVSRTIETLYRSESGRVLATLVRLLGDLDLAEESMHEAFAAALESWTLAGIPDKPRPWLISTARFKASVLCQLDDDPLGAAHVAELVAVLVALQLADELNALRPQTCDDGVNVFDGERDMADPKPVRRRVLVAGLRRRRVEFCQLESSVAVRGLQHRDICSDAFEPHDAVHPAALNQTLSLQFESKLDEELDCGREVVNHDANMLHP
jgi:hypothetical protein